VQTRILIFQSKTHRLAQRDASIEAIIIIIITYLFIYLLTAFDFSLGGSSLYISTDITNKYKYT
jgi:hypothetical protein